MSEGLKKSMEVIAGGSSHLIQEFCERSVKEDIVDLYAEYYNRAEDFKCQPNADSKEKNALTVIVSFCEKTIAQKALAERGYFPHLITKYVKRN